MLHVVPALILLIFQGPSGADRLPCHGGLPAVLEALNAQLQPTPRDTATTSSRHAAIASLLALGAKDPHWSAAIARFLDGTGFAAASPVPAEVSVGQRHTGAAVRILDPCPRVQRPPFVTSSRFRDGPSSR